MNANNTKPVAVTADNFEAEVLDSSIPVVVDFWAPWCGPCRMIGPVLERLAVEYADRVKVAKVNTDQERGLANAFQIRGIPTLYVVQNGDVTGSVVGFHGAEALSRMFEDLASGKLQTAHA